MILTIMRKEIEVLCWKITFTKDKKTITLNKDSLEAMMHWLLCSRFFPYTHLMKLEVNPFRGCTSVNIY